LLGLKKILVLSDSGMRKQEVKSEQPKTLVRTKPPGNDMA